jgi:CheY-like chemotaxis protein
MRAAQQAVELVRQLLTFSRETPASASAAVDVASCLEEMLPLLRRLVGERVSLQLRRAEVPLPATIGAAPLEQVVVNLVVNARDAMPHGGGVVLDVREVEVDGGSDEVEMAPGPYVRLEVSDGGEGIPPAVLEHVFEPFFTTKPAGEGTGLGLSTTFGIVRQAGGSIAVHSVPGEGTTFHVYLPVAPAVVSEPELPAAPHPAKGGAVVLLVEDDDAVRKVAERTLTGLGYEVLATDGGETAVAVARHFQRRIDILLTDVVMPGMSGPEVAAAIAADRPDLRVIYMTGYTNAEGAGARPLPSGAFVVAKPLLATTLAQATFAALESEPAARPRAS